MYALFELRELFYCALLHPTAPYCTLRYPTAPYCTLLYPNSYPHEGAVVWLLNTVRKYNERFGVHRNIQTVLTLLNNKQHYANRVVGCSCSCKGVSLKPLAT